MSKVKGEQEIVPPHTKTRVINCKHRKFPPRRTTCCGGPRTRICFPAMAQLCTTFPGCPPSGTPSKIFFFPFSPWLQLPSLMLLCSVEDLSSSGITPLKQTNYENELLYCFYAGLWSACPHIKCEIKPASKSFVMSLFRKMCL